MDEIEKKKMDNNYIGFYYNEDEKRFDLFLRFKGKCPKCENDIFEFSCYSCCHKNNCGKVNYGTFYIDKVWGLELDLTFNYSNEYLSYDTIKSSIHDFTMPSKLFHHYCNNCHKEFYTLKNN